MSELEYWLDQALRSRTSRREFISRAASLGVTTALATSMLAKTGLADAPVSGGSLRQGLGGGATTDSFDPTTWVDNVAYNLGRQVFNSLVEIDSKREATPELAESWEAKPGAAEWIFNIRKGVQFHNGKELDVDDVMYSLQLHMGKDSKSGAKPLLTSIKEIKKLDNHQMMITLDSGNADLPFNLSEYTLVVLPKDFNDWANPIGTGGYALENYEPGVRALAKRAPNYWKAGKAHFDSVETIVINDTTARTQALLSGAVDVINRVDRKTAKLMKGAVITQSTAGLHYPMPMDCTSSELKDKNVRLALKYAINREQILETLLHGFGQVGNDHSIPPTDRFFNNELPQRAYDPDKAKFHLKQAGLDSFGIKLHTSNGAWPEAVDAAVLYQESARAAGINLDVVQRPADSYWDSVWMKVPFCMSIYNGRPTADVTLSLVYHSKADWNDARWSNLSFDKLLLEARAELDFEKRKAMYWEMQRIINDDGGHIVPVFADILDASSETLKGLQPNPLYELNGFRLAEQGWFGA